MQKWIVSWLECNLTGAEHLEEASCIMNREDSAEEASCIMNQEQKESAGEGHGDEEMTSLCIEWSMFWRPFSQ